MNNKNRIPESDILDVKGCAHFLKIKVSTVYSYILDNTIPYYKPQSKVYFLRSELEDYILNNRFRTQEEVLLEAQKYNCE